MAEDRVARARQALADQDVAALLITAGPDVHYLSGFRSSNGTLLITADGQFVITDFRYRTQLDEQAPDWSVVEQAPKTTKFATIAQAVKDQGVTSLAFQSDHLTYANFQSLQQALEFENGALKPATGLVSSLREVKDAAELAKVREAARIADATMHHAFEVVKVGMTERQLKAELEHFMLEQGAEGPSFDMILAGGEHSALPHAPVTERPLAAGDLLTLDLGAVYEGYCSDLTRTVAIVSCDGERKAIYQLVYRAQIAAIEAIRPGALGKDVDEIARAIIRNAGHEDHFGHGLGHGVGIEIHEGPRLASSGDKPLEVGQVVTIEPGVYIPGVGGVRIEDLAVVTASGCELLSDAKKTPEPMIVGV